MHDTTHVNGWVSRLSEMHKTKFPFVSRAYRIYPFETFEFSAHVFGVVTPTRSGVSPAAR